MIPAAAPPYRRRPADGRGTRLPEPGRSELTGAASGIVSAAGGLTVRMDRMFVGLIELGILGALLDLLFVSISRHLVHWEQT